MIDSVVIKQIYQGDGETTQFPFAFPFESADHVKVSIYDTETETETQLTSDYYVDATASKVLYPGYPPGEEPPESERPGPLPVGQKLVIYRDTPINQLEDLGEKYPLTIIEDMIDKVTMILQEFGDQLDRALIVDMAADITPAEFLDAFKEGVQKAVDKAAEAATSALNASNSAGAAHTSEVNADESARDAAASLEEAKEIASVIGVVGEPYDPTKTYHIPDIVITPDGTSWRCIQTSTGEYPATSSKWVALALAQGETFEYDEDGNLQPRAYAQSSSMWQIDDDGNIMPQEVISA
jgi:hypothetical protein